MQQNRVIPDLYKSEKCKLQSKQVPKSTEKPKDTNTEEKPQKSQRKRNRPPKVTEEAKVVTDDKYLSKTKPPPKWQPREPKQDRNDAVDIEKRPPRNQRRVRTARVSTSKADEDSNRRNSDAAKRPRKPPQRDLRAVKQDDENQNPPKRQRVRNAGTQEHRRDSGGGTGDAVTAGGRPRRTNRDRDPRKLKDETFQSSKGVTFRRITSDREPSHWDQIMQNGGFTNSQVNTLLSRGVKPWDTDARKFLNEYNRTKDMSAQSRRNPQDRRGSDDYNSRRGGQERPDPTRRWTGGAFDRDKQSRFESGGGGLRGGRRGAGDDIGRRGPMKCYNCQGEGHSSRDCPEPRKVRGGDGGGDRGSITCYNCQGEGHMARDCNEQRKSREGGGDRDQERPETRRRTGNIRSQFVNISGAFDRDTQPREGGGGGRQGDEYHGDRGQQRRSGGEQQQQFGGGAGDRNRYDNRKSQQPDREQDRGYGKKEVGIRDSRESEQQSFIGRKREYHEESKSYADTLPPRMQRRGEFNDGSKFQDKGWITYDEIEYPRSNNSGYSNRR